MCKCFNYKEKGHTTYNYLKKERIAAILENVNKDNNSQEKD